MMISISEMGTRAKVLERLRAKIADHTGEGKRVMEFVADAVERETPVDADEVSVSLNLFVHYHVEPKQEGHREVGS